MDLSRETQQRDEFRSLLIELAKSQELLQDEQDRVAMFNRLENLYAAPAEGKRFRHFYSDIFSVLTRIREDSSLGDINILGQNLDVIRREYVPQNLDGEGISDNINKLYDHVSLDIARILYSDAGDRKISGEETIEGIQTKVKEIEVAIEETKKFQQETEEKISSQQKEYIAILGIFAAVVLAFTTGIAFSTSVLENISTVSIYRIVIVSLLIGLVILNILFALFFYIDKLVNKTRQIKPIIISNIILLVLLAVTVLAWYFGTVESRNARINDCLVRQEEVTDSVKQAA